MLEAYFQGIVLTSLLGTVFVLLLLAIKPVTQKHFSESWHYYIWLVVLVAMLLPVRIELPKIPHNPAVSHAGMQFGYAVENMFESVGIKERAADKILYDEAGHRLYSPHLQERRMREIALERMMDSIVWCWFGVAMLVFWSRVIHYCFYVSKLKKVSKEVECPEIATYTRRKVQVRIVPGYHGSFVHSPLLLGIVKPILLLPDIEMTNEQLHNVLAHEMTHLLRHDMIYKWFVMLVKCIHWFNPVVAMINSQVNQSCEISCDLRVTESMTREQKISYVDTILTLFTGSKHREYALSMGMTGSKKLLKKRFLKMKNRIAISEKMRKLSGVAAAVMLIGVMVVSGSLATKVFPDLTNQNLPPMLSECIGCGQETLFYQRVVVAKDEEDTLQPYYDYLFHCEKCGNHWIEEYMIQSAYIFDMKTKRIERVEDMMAYAHKEEVFIRGRND